MIYHTHCPKKKSPLDEAEKAKTFHVIVVTIVLPKRGGVEKD